MELLNEITKNFKNCSNEIKVYTLSRFSVLVSPVAPHLGEECWSLIGNKKSLMESPLWFTPDKNALIEDTVNIAIQVNGKLRSTLEVVANSEQNEVKELVFKDKKVSKHTAGKEIIKEIFVKNRIYNIVVK